MSEPTRLPVFLRGGKRFLKGREVTEGQTTLPPPRTTFQTTRRYQTITTVKTRLSLSRHGDVLTLLGKLTLYVIALVLSVPTVTQIRAQGIQSYTPRLWYCRHRAFTYYQGSVITSNFVSH